MQEATKPRLIAGTDKQARTDDISSEARLFPPLAEPPDPDNAVQLNVLRKRVSEYWVDGVLKHSLYNEVLISLEKRQVDKNVDAPWKYTVELAGVADSTPLDDRKVNVIYDATGLPLILGEPGSGKTTTLLDRCSRVRDWLSMNQEVRETIPDGAEIFARYGQFMVDRPTICKRLRLRIQGILYTDYITVVESWSWRMTGDPLRPLPLSLCTSPGRCLAA